MAEPALSIAALERLLTQLKVEAALPPAGPPARAEPLPTSWTWTDPDAADIVVDELVNLLEEIDAALTGAPPSRREAVARGLVRVRVAVERLLADVKGVSPFPTS